MSLLYWMLSVPDRLMKWRCYHLKLRLPIRINLPRILHSALTQQQIALGMSMTAGGDFSWTPTEEQGGASYNVTVTVTDNGTNPADLTDFETVNITVNEVNVAPVLDAIGARSVDEMAVLHLKLRLPIRINLPRILHSALTQQQIALGMSMTASR
jgi:hypothetical protein